MKINIIFPIIKKLYSLLSKRHKLYFIMLTVITIGSSLIETIGISVIMPFISVAANPDLLDSGRYKQVFDFFHFANKVSFIITLGICIICFYIFRAVYTMIHLYLQNRFTQAIYKQFSSRLFNIFLSISYKKFVQKNSGEMMYIIYNMSQSSSTLTSNILQFFTELFTIMLIYALMLIVNMKMTLILTLVLLLLIIVFLGIVIKKSRALGIKQTETGKKISRTIRQTFGNYKYTKLKGDEKEILHNFSKLLNIHTGTQLMNIILGAIPKVVLECLGFSLLAAVVIVILVIYNDAAKVIPIIAMYALAMYRILPAIHRILGNVNNIAFHQKALDIIDENVRQDVENEGDVKIDFKDNIRLEDVNFKYVVGNNIFDSVSLKIKKGEKIAITGESGCGKSTLVDLVIGIHKPVSGSLYIDDTLVTNENIRSWRSKIGYIPQSIYLFDGTVAENICIASEIDEERVRQVLLMANIWDFLCTKEGINTKVGEGGIQLSGGQQQRVGIARALYNDPDVLVLDEATSALDNETEEKIMEEIYSISKTKTLIVIAHRLSTVERCERKIRIENGVIYE